MRRFFFHIHNGMGFVPDKEGVSLADLDAARDQAIASIRSIVAEEIMASGLIDLGGWIDLVDEDGTVTAVRFSEAVEVRGTD